MSRGNKYVNEKNRTTGTDDIMVLQEYNIEIDELTPNQFRIEDKMDLYPTRNRYHVLATNERGFYPKENLIEWVVNKLNLKI